MRRELGAVGDEAAALRGNGPPRIHVPASGIHYRFEKLYANQALGDAWIAIPYATAGGTWLGQMGVLGGMGLLGIGVFLYRRREERASRRRALGIAGVGFLLVVYVLGRYPLSSVPAVVLLVVVAAVLHWESVFPLLSRIRRLAPTRGAEAS